MKGFPGAKGTLSGPKGISSVPADSNAPTLKNAKPIEPKRFEALPLAVNNYIVKVRSSVYNSSRCSPEFSKAGFKMTGHYPGEKEKTL